MKRSKVILFVLVFGISGRAWAQPIKNGVTETLSLNQSIERAVQNNSRLLAAEKELMIAKANLSEARSLFYPKVNLNFNYARYRHETLGVTPDNLGGFILEAPITDPSGIRQNPLAENLYLGRLGFQQTLYAGGRIKNTMRMSKANIKKAENEYDNLRKGVEYETKKNFYWLLSIQKKLTGTKDILEQLESIAKSRLSAHERLSFTQAKAYFKNKKADLEKREKKAQLEFLNSMGLELFNHVKLVGDLESHPLEADLQRLLAWSKDNRAELKDTQLQEEVDQLSVNLSMAERYPIVRLGGGYEVRNRKFPLNETNWSAILSLDIPLFDGFSSLARIKESRFRAQKSRLRRVRFEDLVEKEVRSSFDDYHHWKQALGTVEENLSELEKVKTRYKSSSQRKASEKMEFLRWMGDAKESVVEAKHGLCLSYARLEKAVGRSINQ